MHIGAEAVSYLPQYLFFPFYLETYTTLSFGWHIVAQSKMFLRLPCSELWHVTKIWPGD